MTKSSREGHEDVDDFTTVILLIIFLFYSTTPTEFKTCHLRLRQCTLSLSKRCFQAEILTDISPTGLLQALRALILHLSLSQKAFVACVSFATVDALYHGDALIFNKTLLIHVAPENLACRILFS